MILTHEFLRSRPQMLYESVDDRQRRVINENHQLYEATTKFDVFLSHSSLDHDEVIILLQLFNKSGYSVYVDWIYDKQLDRSNVTAKTAETLRMRMQQSRGLSYWATDNASHSKWCPWELGYFDGLSNSRCCILPVLTHEASTYKGQEYLGLYPYLQYAPRQDTGENDFWVHDQYSSKYVRLDLWLKGQNPSEH